MLKYFITILLILGVQTAFTQHKTLKITGDITDTAGVGVVNCTVTISGIKDGLIYSHFNTGNVNNFKTEVSINANDSLMVEVRHLAFTPFKRIYYIANDVSVLRFSVTLRPAVQKLDQVNVSPPRVWKRGDTTFYKVDMFKEGEEKKLKDMLLKLPDFKQDNNGQITYKNKPLDKITIDGEELFADKIELMLNNFPVHVLNTVQVIENQSNERLLKGLAAGNKTFINLQIVKKNSLSLGFGEMEAGAGNQGRYNFSPIIFSMYSNIKLGFIGNYNSIGNGIGLQQEGELRNTAEREAQQLLMGNHTLSHINNFEQRWYVRNRQWDNRFQINVPLSKIVKSRTEVGYVNDRQPQNAYYNLLLLNNERYEQRIDSSFNLYKPAILSVKQSFNIQPDSVHELKITANLYNDRSLGEQETIFRGFGIGSPLAVGTQNKWLSLSLSGDYTIRNTERKANTFALIINKQNLNQDAVGQSGDVAKIFSLPGDYNRMMNQIGTTFFTAEANWKMLIRGNKNRLTNLGISAGYKSIHLNQTLQISQSEVNNTPVKQNDLSNVSDYNVIKLTASFLQSFKFILHNPFFFTTEFGAARYSPEGISLVSAFNTPLLKATISHEHSFFEGLDGKFNGGIYQWQYEPERLYSRYYPSSILSFRRSLNFDLPLRRFEGYYVLAYHLPNDLTSLALLFSGTIQPNGIVAYNSYESFIAFTDSYLINQSTGRGYVSFSISMPSLLLNAMIDFNAAYSKNTLLVASGNQIWKSSLDNYSFFISFKKNWKRKYFIKLSSSFYTNINHLPANAGNAENKISSLKSIFYQRFVINKQMSLASSVNLYHNNLFTSNQAHFTMADLEWNYQIKKSPLNLSVRAENILNEKNYYNFSNSVLSQSFSTIPLIGRSIYTSVRYSF